MLLVYARLQRLPVGYFDQRSSGDLMTRVLEDVNAVERVLIDGTEQGTVAILSILGVIIILFWTNPLLAAVALIPLPLLAAGALWYTLTAHRRYRLQRESASAMNALLMDNQVDILAYPAPKWHANDGGQYIGTECMVIAQDPELLAFGSGEGYRVLAVRGDGQGFPDPKGLAEHLDVVRLRTRQRGFQTRGGRPRLQPQRVEPGVLEAGPVEGGPDHLGPAFEQAFGAHRPGRLQFVGRDRVTAVPPLGSSGHPPAAVGHQGGRADRSRLDRPRALQGPVLRLVGSLPYTDLSRRSDRARRSRQRVERRS